MRVCRISAADMITIVKTTVTRCFHALLCLITFVIIALFLYAGLVISINFFSSKPRFEVSPSSSLSISNASRTGTTITWDIVLTVKNPSKKLHVQYPPLYASVYYSDKSFTTIEIPPFSQETRNETVLKLRFREEMQELDGLAEDLENGEVTVKVVLSSAGLRIGPRAMWVVDYHLRVNCEDLEFKNSNDNTGSWKLDERKDCQGEILL